MLVLFVIVAFIIFLYCSYIKQERIKDVLSREILPGSDETRLDGWRLSHFLFFAILGWLYPYCWKFAFFIGALWELIEEIVAMYRSDFHASFMDIVVDMLGFFLGRGLRLGSIGYHCAGGGCGATGGCANACGADACGADGMCFEI